MNLSNVSDYNTTLNLSDLTHEYVSFLFMLIHAFSSIT